MGHEPILTRHVLVIALIVGVLGLLAGGFALVSRGPKERELA